MKLTRLAGAAVVLALCAVGCGTSSDDSGGSAGDSDTPGGFTAPDVPMASELGDNEGALSILAWPGYAEDGSTDKTVDWVTPFEEKTGCQVDVKTFGTSDEAVSLMQSGQYDVVSASGDASLRLIAGGDVAPVNTDLVPNYADVWPFLKDRPWNSVDDQMYGIPHGYGANLLMWRTDKVDPAPTSWSAVFDDSSAYAGKVTAYDSPIYIADAALYLMNTQPDLGIEDPYALDADQLAAAVELLKAQKANVGEYWSDYLKEVQAFTTGDSIVGTTWQVIANLAEADKVPVKAILPEEGSTGWSDTWMVGSETEHPNCAYAWLDHIISPEANDAVAEWFGEAPASSKACEIATKGFCESYHAGDEAYAEKIHYWTTPIEECLDGRTDVTCTTYQEWTQAWTEIKG
ncbi:ABC transporter substrate-binding protein [Nocardioides currus]|uniref:Spermidine/putrescine ABC transporter substrate-binding protein n=1 Tax=Nocardioides currus TaxID=2133958 RepID=A0A2R7YSL0_9ACTN|nr:ABC transporter substrate-binding protein [Nocardioides currus]PUA79293.1 spermidine/putrescine ABC transporter substrate-binding protein [Nocardioides currus]